MIEEKTMGITTTLKKTYPRKGGRVVQMAHGPWGARRRPSRSWAAVP